MKETINIFEQQNMKYSVNAETKFSFKNDEITQAWVNNMTLYLDLLLDVQLKIKEETETVIDTGERSAIGTLMFFGLLLIVTIFGK